MVPFRNTEKLIIESIVLFKRPNATEKNDPMALERIQKIAQKKNSIIKEKKLDITSKSKSLKMKENYNTNKSEKVMQRILI